MDRANVVYEGILGLRSMHEISNFETVLTKSFCNMNNPALKVLCKFQVNIPINERVTAAQSSKNLHTFIL